MLERLLELVAAGRMATVVELAAELGTSEGLVVGMLDDLAQRGLLQVVEACRAGCEGCGSACAVALHGRAFVLSDAGRAWLRRSS